MVIVVESTDAGIDNLIALSRIFLSKDGNGRDVGLGHCSSAALSDMTHIKPPIPKRKGPNPINFLILLKIRNKKPLSIYAIYKIGNGIPCYTEDMKNFADKAKATLKAINDLRPVDSNKGTFGHAYILGGSLEYSGAPYLSYSASSAYRGGIGYAHLALPRSLIHPFMLKDPQAILTPMSEHEDGFLKYNEEELSSICNKAKGIAFGMGAGVSIEVANITKYLLKHYSGVLLFDADALNSISEYALTGLLKEHVGQLILAPHLREFSKLSGLPLEEVEAKQKELAEEYAAKWNCILVLKSYKTYVSDGKETYEVSEGNSGLAKAGSGDLLSGLIIGLSWAYPALPLLDLAATGSYVLGKAAENVSKKRGGKEFATTAFDIVNAIPEVF